MFDPYYLGFSALIQLAVAFGFGLLYLTRRKRSIFNDVLATVSGLMRNNRLWVLVLSYPKYVYRNMPIRKLSSAQKKWRAFLVACVEVCESSFNAEISCRYLSAVGSLSAIYSMWWLLFVPLATKYVPEAENIYMTIALCTFIVQLIMLLYAIFAKLTEVKAFVISMIYLMIFSLTGLWLLGNGFYIASPLSFDEFFLRSLAVPYMPVIMYCGHILLSMITRSVVLIMSLLLATILRFV